HRLYLRRPPQVRRHRARNEQMNAWIILLNRAARRARRVSRTIGHVRKKGNIKRLVQLSLSGSLALASLPAWCSRHHFDERLSHLRLETFGVPLVQAEHVSDDASTFALRIRVHLRGSGPRLASPTGRTSGSGTSHVPFLFIDDVGVTHARTTLILF